MACIFHWPSRTSLARLILNVADDMVGGQQAEDRYTEIATKYDMKNPGLRPTNGALSSFGWSHPVANPQLHTTAPAKLDDTPLYPHRCTLSTGAKPVPHNPKANLNRPTVLVIAAAPWYSEFVGQTVSLNKPRADMLVATTQLAGDQTSDTRVNVWADTRGRPHR